MQIQRNTKEKVLLVLYKMIKLAKAMQERCTTLLVKTKKMMEI